MLIRAFIFFSLLIPSISFANGHHLSCTTQNGSTIELMLQSEESQCDGSTVPGSVYISAARKMGKFFNSSIQTACGPNNTVISLEVNFGNAEALLFSFANGLNGRAQIQNLSKQKTFGGKKLLRAECTDSGLPGLPAVSGGN